MYTIVLIAEKALASDDVADVTSLHEGEDAVRFVVLMPAEPERHRFITALDDVVFGRFREAAHEVEHGEATEDARTALETTVAGLRAAGAEVHGHLAPRDPVKLLRECVAEHEADEVIVLTEPHWVEEAVHRDWASRARHEVGVPVLRLLPHGERPVRP
ncbi:MAG: indole-3-glycerol phosphate synthase [Acidimicrobiia bacterium]